MRRRFLIGGSLVVLALLVVAAAFAYSTWAGVRRVDIDRGVGALSGEASGPGVEAKEPSNRGANPGVPGQYGAGLDVFLLVGSDSRADLEDLSGFGDFEGQRADVVIVLLRTEDGAALLSLPRDLLVADVCDPGSERKLTDALEGCVAGVNGPTALTLTVEQVVGRKIDHFALVDLAGFQEVVDAVGGYRICLPRAVRDQRANLELPAGCTLASGAQTLAWLRSRSTQELTENGWRVMPGVNDLTRNQRQRQFLLDMLGRLSDFSSPTDVADMARTIVPYVTVDSKLSLLQAIDLAWSMRGLGRGLVEELEVEYVDATTEDGAAVLVPVGEIDEVVDEFVGSETVDAPLAGT